MTSAKHLLILSGQSNMQRIKPAQSFTPIIAAKLGADSIIVVKEAWGGQPIRRWCKDWQAVVGIEWPAREHRRVSGDLYDRLIDSVRSAIKGQRLASVTLVWMQGEEDAVEHLAAAYKNNLTRLLQQLRQDLGFDGPLLLVVGKLNNYGLALPIAPYWQLVQKAQLSVVAESCSASLVETADLDISGDGLHFSAAGYQQLGQRFACAAIELIHKNDMASR